MGKLFLAFTFSAMASYIQASPQENSNNEISFNGTITRTKCMIEPSEVKIFEKDEKFNTFAHPSKASCAGLSEISKITYQPTRAAGNGRAGAVIIILSFN